MKKRNEMIEVFRGLACLLVVFCHFRIWNKSGAYIIALARFAVPFFLIISGYFSLQQSKIENILWAKRKLIATFRLLIFGILICALANTCICIIKGETPLKWFIDIINIKTLFLLDPF